MRVAAAPTYMTHVQPSTAHEEKEKKSQPAKVRFFPVRDLPYGGFLQAGRFEQEEEGGAAGTKAREGVKVSSERNQEVW